MLSDAFKRFFVLKHGIASIVNFEVVYIVQNLNTDIHGSFLLGSAKGSQGQRCPDLTQNGL